MVSSVTPVERNAMWIWIVLAIAVIVAVGWYLSYSSSMNNTQVRNTVPSTELQSGTGSQGSVGLTRTPVQTVPENNGGTTGGATGGSQTMPQQR
jgi:hypothetical protein